jgi:nucleoside 2-deoxyribosyltransferase
LSNRKTYTVYFGGELFSTKHLLGNAALAAAIRRRSHGRYEPILPQDFEQRDASAQAIRDQDLRALLGCDLGLFNYDGPELDSGTVVEFLFAKFADIPAVLLRTDFRGAGDQAQGDPWNLMTSFYPRTLTVVLDAMAMYQRGLAGPTAPAGRKTGSVPAAQGAIESTADQIIAAFEQVLESPPILTGSLRSAVYQWLALMPGFHAGTEEIAAELLARGVAKTAEGTALE